MKNVRDYKKGETQKHLKFVGTEIQLSLMSFEEVHTTVLEFAFMHMQIFCCILVFQSFKALCFYVIFKKNGADSNYGLIHKLTAFWHFLFCSILLVVYSVPLNNHCSHWLCISAYALAAPLSASRRTSRAPCLSRTAKPSRGSLPWAQTLTHIRPLTSTHSSCRSLCFFLSSVSFIYLPTPFFLFTLSRGPDTISRMSITSSLSLSFLNFQFVNFFPKCLCISKWSLVNHALFCVFLLFDFALFLCSCAAKLMLCCIVLDVLFFC